MPIYSLADLRSSAPANLQDASDPELLKAYAAHTGMDIMQVAQMLGVPTGKDRNAFMAGLSSGVDDLQGLGYSAIAAGANAVGLRGAQNWANRRADMNQVESQLNGRPDLEQVEDVYDKPSKYGPYAAYQLAKQGPQIAAAIAAGFVVPEVAVPAALSRGAALLPRAFGGGGMSARAAAAAAEGGSEFAARRAALEAGQTFGKQVVGGGAMNYAQGVGSLYQDANDGGNSDAGLAALAGGLPYALTETLPEAMLVGRFAHGGGFKGGLATRMGKAGVTQAAAGATSELAQNEMEMAFHGNVSSEQAFSRRLNSGVTGGLVEGILGMGGGIRRGRVPTRTVDQGSTDLLGLGEYQPGPDAPAREFNVPDLQTTPGAGGPIDPRAVPFARDVDTSGLSLAPREQPQDNGISFEPTDATGGLSLVPKGNYPVGPDGLPYTRDILTGGLALRAPTEAATPDMFGGDPRVAQGEQSRPDFSLTSPDPREAGQGEMDFSQPVIPFEPRTPQGAQRGVPGQLPFSSNTSSPKGQVLQGLTDALGADGHLDEGAHTQASTLIAQGKFAAAKKIIDEAMKNKTAADTLIAKAQEEHMNAPAPDTKAEADRVFQEVQQLKAERQALVGTATRPPRAGTKKATQLATLDEKINAGVAQWGELTRKKETPDARTPATTAGRTADPAASAGVQPSGGGRDAGAVQPARVSTPPAALVPTGEQAEPAVPANTEHPAALSTQEVVQVADDSKDIHEYESALDDLYRRWRDDGDAEAQAYFEGNAKVPGFAADYARTRERAGDAPTSEGKNGLKMGRSAKATVSHVTKETDDVLRGLAQPKMSLSEGEQQPEDPVRTARIQTFAEALVRDWHRQPHIVTLDSILSPDLPEKVSGDVDTMRAQGLEGEIKGVFWRDAEGGDTIYLFANAIRDSSEAIQVIFHEGLGHYGLRGVYGKALGPVLASLARVRPDLVRAKAKAYALNVSDLNDLLTAADEVLAEMAQTRPNLTWVQQALAAIRTWLREHVPGFSKLQVSDDEIIRDYVIPARNWVERGQKATRGQIKKLAAPELMPTEESAGATRLSVANPANKPLGDAFGKSNLAQSTLGQKIQDALYNLAESPWALKWTTNDQIAEGYKHLKPVLDINRATGRMAAVANRYLETASQTAKKWRALPDAVQLDMQRVMLKSTMAESHVAIKVDGHYLGAEEAYNHPSNSHLEKTPETRVAFGRLYQEWNALPAPAKAVYDTVKDDLTTQHEDTLRALRKTVADQYATQLKRTLTDDEITRLASAQGDVKALFQNIMDVAGNPTELRALNHMYQALRDVNKDFGTVRGPYFPLVRFGDHVVVMKSAALVDLEATSRNLREELQQAMEDAPAVADEASEGHDAKVADLRERYNRALEAVNAAKQDEKKYVVEFHETPAQAERARQALADKNPGSDVYRSVKEQYYRGLDGASPAFLKNLTETLSAALDTGEGVTAEAKATALQSVKDMYMRRQPERSALRAELKRMSIEGVQSGQMLRGYAQSARNGAWRISRLLHAGEVTSGLAALSEDRRSADAKHVLNELKSRFVGDIAPPANNKLLQKISGATYFMHLGFNISYFATNATQAWVTSLPVMAGRHGIVNSSNSLMAASKDVLRLLSQATAQSVKENGAVVGLQLRLTDDQINSLAKDAGEARMLKALTDDGVIDITIKHDLGAISDGTTKSIPGKILELSGAMANYPELYNRLSTALAAYRMESARHQEAGESAGLVQDRAEKYAEYIINRTHFNYSPENAPRMMRGQLGRLVFQFKRYQQGMIYLFAKLTKDAYHGDTDAARSLAYLLGITMSVGGVVSLPIAAPVALAAKIAAAFFPDDDEPDWLQQFYNGMKDGVGENLAQTLVKGLPTLAGLDLSGKLGQGNLLDPMAFANTTGKKFFSRDYWTEAGFGLLGPAAAMLGNEAEAVGAAKNGDFLKAAEKGLPTFVANAVKAFHRADAGLTTKQGDTIMEPEEFNALSTGMKAIGFESVKVSDMYQDRSSYMNAVHNRTEVRQGLLRQYYEAVKAGDGDAIASTRDAISEFNQRQPADRVKSSDLSASIKTHAQRAKETTGGLRVGKRDRDTYQQAH